MCVPPVLICTHQEYTTDYLNQGLKQFFVSAVEVRAPYQGRQLAAWLAFYREPKECYGVRQTALIVDCVNRRQQAQRRFEKQWVQQRSQILSDLRSQ